MRTIKDDLLKISNSFEFTLMSRDTHCYLIWTQSLSLKALNYEGVSLFEIYLGFVTY